MKRRFWLGYIALIILVAGVFGYPQVTNPPGSGGTLATSSGGTGTATVFTQGSVVFAGTSGNYAQNNSLFFWDNSNNVLRLGGPFVNAVPAQTKLLVTATGTTPQGVCGERISITADANNDYGAFICHVDYDGTGSGQAIMIGDRAVATDRASVVVRNGNLGVYQTNPQTAIDVGGTTRSALYATATNCSSSSGTCGAAASGAVAIAAAATTVTVATTAVTANSNILITENSAMGSRLSVTCNTTAGRVYAVTTLTANTSFVITASAAPATNPACLQYLIMN